MTSDEEMLPENKRTHIKKLGLKTVCFFFINVLFVPQFCLGKVCVRSANRSLSSHYRSPRPRFDYDNSPVNHLENCVLSLCGGISISEVLQHTVYMLGFSVILHASPINNSQLSWHHSAVPKQDSATWRPFLLFKVPRWSQIKFQ